MTETAIAEMAPEKLMHSIIQRIATGPELSKDISQEEANYGLQYILDGKIDQVQAAIFFIALRMKRETWDENRGVLDALLAKTKTVTAPVDEVFAIVDPYNGYNRTLPPAPFLPALLAECGVPTVTEGVETLAPKYGVTHKQILRAAGVPVDLTPDEAAARLGDSATGWTYVDQSQFCPAVYNLIDLRTRMVKRQVLTTVEVLTGPIRGKKKTHFATGFVHKPYPPVYAMLARHSGFDSAILMRGIEGGVIPSLRQPGRAVYYHEMAEEHEVEFNPADFGVEQENRAVPFPEGIEQINSLDTVEANKANNDAMVKAAVEAGMSALSGEAGPTHDALMYSAGIYLWHLKKFDSIKDACAAVREVLASGTTVKRIK